MEDLFCIDGRAIKEFIRGRIKTLLDKRELFLYIYIYIANHNQRFVLRPISYSNKSVVLKLKFYSSNLCFFAQHTRAYSIFGIKMSRCRVAGLLQPARIFRLARISRAFSLALFIGTLHWRGFCRNEKKNVYKIVIILSNTPDSKLINFSL